MVVSKHWCSEPLCVQKGYDDDPMISKSNKIYEGNPFILLLSALYTLPPLPARARARGTWNLKGTRQQGYPHISGREMEINVRERASRPAPALENRKHAPCDARGTPVHAARAGVSAWAPRCRPARRRCYAWWRKAALGRRPAGGTCSCWCAVPIRRAAPDLAGRRKPLCVKAQTPLSPRSGRLQYTYILCRFEKRRRRKHIHNLLEDLHLVVLFTLRLFKIMVLFFKSPLNL